MVSVIVVTDVVIEVVVDGVGVAVVVVTGAAVVVVVVGATVVVTVSVRVVGSVTVSVAGAGAGAADWVELGPLVSGADDVVAEVVTLVLAGAEDPNR